MAFVDMSVSLTDRQARGRDLMILKKMNPTIRASLEHKLKDSDMYR